MKTFLLYHTPADSNYLPALKPYLSGCRTFLRANSVSTVTEVLMDAKEKKADGVITTNPRLLNLLRNQLGEKLLSLDDYAGSIIDHKGMEFLILNPLDQLFTVSYGKFLFERYLSKLTKPEKWFKQTEFIWRVANEKNIEYVYREMFSKCDLISIDIETSPEDRRITCVSYTLIGREPENFFTYSLVIPCTSLFWLEWIRKFNNLPVPKIFQNGKYDNAYFFRFKAPVRAWYFDTINLFHSWYSELPKRLDFLATFSLRKVEFWKDESKTGNLEDYYRYNARDGWATANAFLALLEEIPDWGIRNYLAEFPLLFPCHQAEMTGIACDVEQLRKLKQQQQKNISDIDAWLGKAVAPGFNANSPQQVKRLMTVLGSGDLPDTQEKNIKKAMFRHPLNTRVFDKIIARRKAKKLESTYLVEEKLWNGRILFTINPHGTDTARLASTESQFKGWGDDKEFAGLQIHNIPRDRKDIQIKSMFIADTGFDIGEGDYEQAEARDVAYLSGDKNLLDTVESGKDFHSINVEKFFGIPYEQVYDDDKRLVLNKEIRDLSKRVNHGSSYNMGEDVLVDTMGLENIYKARDLLKLPRYWTAKKIARYLLDSYANRYPVVKGDYYDYIRYCVRTTRTLVSPLGWTRYCFGNPEKNKQDLNSYIAHPSQNLNAGTLNRAWMEVFKKIALKEVKDFKLCAQIHDSILFQYRRGREDLVKRVHECMLFPVRVKDCKGVERSLLVPVSMKFGANRWSEIKEKELVS